MGIILAPKLIPLYVAAGGAGVAAGALKDLEGIGWASKDGEYVNSILNPQTDDGREFNSGNGAAFTHAPNPVGEGLGAVLNGAIAGVAVAAASMPLGLILRVPGPATQAVRLGAATMVGVTTERVINGTRDGRGTIGESREPIESYSWSRRIAER